MAASSCCLPWLSPQALADVVTAVAAVNPQARNQQPLTNSRSTELKAIGNASQVFAKLY